MFKKFLNSTTSAVSIILVLAILAMVNYISLRNFTRWDFTEDKQYSISEATKTTLGELDDLITVKVYFSKKLPPELTELSQYVHDILDEYKAYSQGNLNVLYLDPTVDDEIKNEALALGIPELQMNVLEKDKFQVQNGFLGIGIFYEDKQEVLPVVQTIETLEYDLTSTIKKVSADRVKVIGFLTGHGEHLTYQGAEDGRGDFTLIRKELEKNYEVKNVVIDKGEQIEGIDTLIVAGPQEEFSERDLFEIDQFIMQGGQAIFMLDGVKVGDQMQALVNETGIEPLVDHYGVKVNHDLVIDSLNESVSFSSGYMRFVVPYALWPKLDSENFDSENVLLSKIESLVLPWASSLEIVEKADLKTEILATTTKYGGRISENFNLNPNQEFQAEGGLEKVDMLALSSGEFKSYFAGETIPEVESKEDLPTEEIALNLDLELPDDSEREVIEQRAEEGKILVIGDSDFLADAQLQRFAQNALFFLNAVDYLTLDADLMSIRSRGLADRSFEEISEEEKFVIKFIGIALIPILVGIFAVLKAFLRKKFKAAVPYK